MQGDEPWFPHFVLRLISEYVVAIGQTALDHIDAIPRRGYEAFAAENPAFLTLTRSRIVNYHGWHYRSMKFTDYPGYRFLRGLDLNGKAPKRAAGSGLTAESQAITKQLDRRLLGGFVHADDPVACHTTASGSPDEDSTPNARLMIA